MNSAVRFHGEPEMNSPAHDSRTIAAISTPPGAGGIGIIRISGNESRTILQTIFTPANPPCSLDSHRLYYGTITDPAQAKLLDEVLVVYMQAPRTYTREDVVEIHCHGGFLILQSVLELICAHGAELAEPGEFTKRAFLNGRIDLTRAEAVIDVLSARTRKGVDLALEQMSGALYAAVDRLRCSLVEIRALLETAIDFPEEEIEIADHQALVLRLQAIVIIGRPNVGKSSLLNTLLQEERALVTSVPGTTRDTIEEYIDIHGIPVRIIDTAGIREDVEEVEELGIRRARESLNRADLVLFLVDGSEPIDDDDVSLFETVKHKPTITVINKCDLEQRLERRVHQRIVDGAVEISAREQTGLEHLKEQVFQRITGGREQWQEEGCTPNLRHKAALEKALLALNRVAEGLAEDLHNDLLMVDLLECLDHLGDIVGETTNEDVLDVIFEQFCLGK
jgi:tRNA modification GTPase